MRIFVRYIELNGFRRFLLQREDGRFWTPKSKWSRHQRKAMLFANLGDAHKAYFKLTDTKLEGPCRHFTARFDIFVNGRGEFDVNTLMDWLQGHVEFTVTTEDGPVDGCKCQVYARFGSLIERC